MDADGAVDVGRTFRHRAHTGKPAHARADGEEMPDSLGARGIEHAVEFGGKVGEIEMAMAVDKHEPNLSD